MSPLVRRAVASVLAKMLRGVDADYASNVRDNLRSCDVGEILESLYDSRRCRRLEDALHGPFIDACDKVCGVSGWKRGSDSYGGVIFENPSDT